jgi:hypothetical protein
MTDVLNVTPAIMNGRFHRIREQEMEVSERTAWMSILTNLVLVSIKIVVTLISGSLAVKADALHSLADVVSSAVILIGIRISKQTSRSFPYGLYKVENLVALATSCVKELEKGHIISKELENKVKMEIAKVDRVLFITNPGRSSSFPMQFQLPTIARPLRSISAVPPFFGFSPGRQVTARQFPTKFWKIPFAMKKKERASRWPSGCLKTGSTC